MLTSAGPSGWTNLWRMFHVHQGQSQRVIQELHEKYGPVVRIAPNVLDLDVPELVKTVYNARADFLKVGAWHRLTISVSNGL